MFAIIDSGGIHTTYVPGKFRDRQVNPIQKVSRIDRLAQESQSPQMLHSQTSKTKSSEIQAYETVESLWQSTHTTPLAKEIMSSPVVSLSQDVDISHALDLIYQRRFRHIPITTENENLIGILSDRDVLRVLTHLTAKNSPSAIIHSQSPIHQIMSQPVLVARPNATIRAIVRVMFEEHIGAVPIVIETGQLRGMITRSDILRLLISHPDFDQWV